MSFRAVTWAFDVVRGLPPTEKLVLLALAEFANDQDLSWPKQETIAARAECSVRSVKRYVAKLESAGLITRKAMYSWCSQDNGACRGRAPHKHRLGSVYHLNLGWRPGDSPADVEDDPAGQPIEAKFAPVEDEGTNPSATGANGGSPQVPPVAPIKENKPPINNPHTLPGRVGDGIVGGNEKVGAGKGESSKESRTAPRASTNGLTPGQWRLIDQCVPAALRSFDPAGAKEVHAALSERITAGWTPEGMAKILGQGKLPERIGRASSLVLSRLNRNVPVDGAPAKRSKARPEPEAEAHNPEDDVLGDVFIEMRAKHPDLPMTQLMKLAQKTVSEREESSKA